MEIIYIEGKTKLAAIKNLKKKIEIPEFEVEESFFDRIKKIRRGVHWVKIYSEGKKVKRIPYFLCKRKGFWIEHIFFMIKADGEKYILKDVCNKIVQKLKVKKKKGKYCIGYQAGIMHEEQTAEELLEELNKPHQVTLIPEIVSKK